jgi:type I restriction enzyme R subunit
MGTEQVFMTTNLRGEKTRFFPFNKTYHNEGVESENYRTSYMWTEVLRRDSVFDLIQNFVNVQVNKDQVYDSRTKGFKEVSSEALIFPRWHQRRAVHKVVADVVERGVGHPYLIKHSAGSGKSNTIAWLAYRLANLYRNPEDEHKIFDSVIVVTDRRVLDRQLQDTLRQFDQAGQLVCIDARKNMRSEDLKNAIEGRKNIIVTTLQKFSVIEKSIQHFPNRKYAVIVDEAHSSQNGESSRNMRSTLSADDQAYFDQRLVEGLESGNEVQDYIDDATEMYDRVRLAAKRKGNHSNISFFAFTATPKEKTLRLFCEKDESDQWRPFDEYTMEQAIKEGFILNVLENYTTYNRYYK